MMKTRSTLLLGLLLFASGSIGAADLPVIQHANDSGTPLLGTTDHDAACYLLTELGYIGRSLP